MRRDRAIRLLQRCVSGVRHTAGRRTARRLRALADEWLLWGAMPRDSSTLLSLRAAELTSQHNRRTLARLCRRLVAELGDPRCRAYAVNRPAMRAHYRALVELAERLEDSSHPLSPAGIVLTERLLADGAGPFYDLGRAGELGPALAAALKALNAPVAPSGTR